MKRMMILFALMVIVPTVAFAQLSLGSAMFLKSPVFLGQEIDVEEVNVNQFSFGGVARFRIGWFQTEGLLLFSAGEVNSLDIFLDAGIALDVTAFTIFLGVGPNFTNNFGEPRAVQVGLNSKLGADLRLGALVVGGSYLTALDITESGIRVERSSGLLGVHLLLQF